MTTTTTNRQPSGTPVGGQFAPGARAAADASVALADNPPPASPLDLPGEQMIAALTEEKDPLGIGLESRCVSRAVHVYYADEDAKAMGVSITRAGNAQIFEYDPDDGDFEYPYLMETTSPIRARAQLIEHLGVSQNISAVVARAKLATPEEIERLDAAYREVHAGARHDVTAAAYDHWFVAINATAAPRHNEVEGGQIARAMTATDADFASHALADAAWALTHRHEIGDRALVSDFTREDGTVWENAGWTQEAYDQMTRPVREVFGPIFPSDDDLEER